METNQAKNEDLEFLIKKDKLIKNDKTFGDKKNSTNMGIYNQLWDAYAKVKVYANSNSVNYNLKNISILCDKDGNLIDNEIDFAVNLVRISVKNHLTQLNEGVRINELIVERLTKNTIKRLFNEEEIKLLNEITNNQFIDKCFKTLIPNLELLERLNNTVNSMIQLDLNDWGKIHSGNNFRHFSMLWNIFQQVKEQIEKKKDNQE